MDQIINRIQLKYPELYNITRKLRAYEKEVSDLFIKNYGNNTFDNLMITNEYHKELENVSKGILKDTDISRLAQKREKIFKEYTDTSYQVAKELGFAKALEYMDILDKYFKRINDFI